MLLKRVNTCTVKNNRNFTDPVMGNCIRKVRGIVNLRESARTFYILTANLRFFCRFAVNSPAVDRISPDLRYIPRNICCREMPCNLKKRGISRQQIFRGITVNPVKYGQMPNLQKICKRTVNWPLIYKMYGHIPVNLRFPVLFLSQFPITGFFLQCVAFYSQNYRLK